MIYFLYGVLFCYLGIPLLEGLLSFFQTFFEWLNSILNKKTQKNNYDIRKMANELQKDELEDSPYSTSCIGFSVHDQEEYYEDDEEEEDKKRGKSK